MKRGLTAEQLAERRKGIGGSDAAIIASGTPEEWHALWLNKTGRAPDADLSDVFAVQLGLVTEELNLYWYERSKGRPVTRRGEAVICAAHDFLRCTLDGFDASVPAIIQAKHVNGFTKLDDCVAKYTPQVTHEMLVCGVADGFLSVIIGTDEPKVVPIEFDHWWSEEYLDRAKQFWAYVRENKEPPGAPKAMSAPAPKPVRKIDFTGNNEWAFHAGAWIEHQTAAKKFKAAEAGLKALVEADVAEATGHGILAKRDGRGVTIKAA